jgi:hypothetical protein
VQNVTNWLFLTILSLLVACGDASYSDVSQAAGNGSRKNSAQPAAGKQNPQDGSKTNIDAPLCCGTQPTNTPQAGEDATSGVLQPVPVVGSYLAALVTDTSGIALPNTEVVLQETGHAEVKSISNNSGYVRLNIADPKKIERITVRRKMGSTLAESSLNFSNAEREIASLSTYSRQVTALPAKLLEMRTGSSGSTLAIATVVNPETDTRPPQLGSINTTPAANGKTVIINASDAESGLHPQAYSFDGGVTWNSSNQFTGPVGSSIPAGQIQVRDRAGNITKSTFTLGL